MPVASPEVSARAACRKRAPQIQRARKRFDRPPCKLALQNTPELFGEILAYAPDRPCRRLRPLEIQKRQRTSRSRKTLHRTIQGAARSAIDRENSALEAPLLIPGLYPQPARTHFDRITAFEQRNCPVTEIEHCRSDTCLHEGRDSRGQALRVRLPVRARGVLLRNFMMEFCHSILYLSKPVWKL